MSYNDNLFETSTMTFGEHLEELRSALVKALLWLAGGFLIGLYVADHVVDVIKSPLEVALREYYLEQANETVKLRLNELQAAGEKVPNWTLVEHSIREDQLFPTPVYIDPREVAAALQATGTPSPNLFIPPVTGLALDDFTNFSAFCQQLVASGEAKERSPAKRIWELLPAEAQALVKKGQKAKLTEDEAQAVMLAFDKILERSDFFQAEDFKTAIETNAELKSVTDLRTGLKPYEIARLNRWLINATLGDPVVIPRKQQLVHFFMWQNIQDDPRIRIKSLSAHEMFMIYMKAALLFGAILASPGMFYHIWHFIAAGLYPHEKRYVQVFLPVSVGLFIVGCVLAFFVFQFVLGFLFQFNRSMGVDPDIRISEWIGMALMLPLGFGLAFQLPLVMLFLERVHITSIEIYMKQWRMAILVIFILAAILTPADPYSMLMLSVPLTFLYFFGIWLCYKWPRNRNPFGELAKTG